MDFTGAFSSLAEWTGLEPATPGVTGRYSNQLNYHSICLAGPDAEGREHRLSSWSRMPSAEQTASIQRNTRPTPILRRSAIPDRAARSRARKRRRDDTLPGSRRLPVSARSGYPGRADAPDRRYCPFRPARCRPAHSECVTVRVCGNLALPSRMLTRLRRAARSDRVRTPMRGRCWSVRRHRQVRSVTKPTALLCSFDHRVTVLVLAGRFALSCTMHITHRRTPTMR